MSSRSMGRGALVLCGGRSTRMGADKAALRLGQDSLLDRVLRVVAQVVPSTRIVCVAAQGQSLQDLPPAVRLVRDQVEDQGPLAALAAGLPSLGSESEAVLVVGCDHPFLSVGLLEELFKQLADSDAVVPDVSGRLHPLPAVYAAGKAAAAAQRVLQKGSRSLHALLDTLDWKTADIRALRDADPGLQSLLACNCPEELEAARRLLQEGSS